MDATNLADLYGSPLLDWDRITARLDDGLTQAPGTGGPNRHTCWLATINPDGSPHVTGIGAIWVDGAFWFETGTQTRKGRNLDRDPRCTLSVAATEFDLVVDGEAQRITDPATVDGDGAALGGRGLAGPSRRHGDRAHRRVQRAVGGTAAVARLPDHRAARATALGTVEPGGATRWRF